MPKNRHGNKEAKKPKQAHPPSNPILPTTPALNAAAATSSPRQRKAR